MENWQGKKILKAILKKKKKKKIPLRTLQKTHKNTQQHQASQFQKIPSLHLSHHPL